MAAHFVVITRREYGLINYVFQYDIDNHTMTSSCYVIGPEKGTDCGPTDGELLLSRPVTAKKRGAVHISFCRIRGLSESVQLIFHVK